MRKLFFTSLLLLIPTLICAAEIPFWQRPTVCKLDTTTCYPSIYGAGYESGMWDTSAKCWGLKLICPEALTTEERYPVPMEKNDISKGKNISSDFDTNVLNNDCFGARKTSSDGSKAYIDGQIVNVWCMGVLPQTPDAEVANGEIISASKQPSCKELADYGYAAVLNKNCYGKYYDMSKYLIQCNEDDLMPERIIILNGAMDYSSKGDFPVDKQEATSLFNKMYEVSKAQHEKYFE